MFDVALKNHDAEIEKLVLKYHSMVGNVRWRTGLEPCEGVVFTVVTSCSEKMFFIHACIRHCNVVVNAEEGFLPQMSQIDAMCTGQLQWKTLKLIRADYITNVKNMDPVGMTEWSGIRPSGICTT